MSFPGDPDGPSGEGDNDAAPTHNRPWPNIDAFSQGRFERRFLVDGDTIDFDRVPQLQSWAHWFGVSDVFRVLAVLKRVSTHSHGAGRPLTGVEATALGEHAAHSSRYFAWVQPLSFSFAAAVAFSGRRTFKFPLYQPKMVKFDPSCFPTKRAPFLRGASATALWHAVRLVAYMPITWIPTAVIFSSMADNSFGAHVMRDERLAPLVDEIRQNARRVIEQEILRRRAGTPNPAGVGSAQDKQQVGDRAHQGGQTPQEYGNPNYQSSTAFEKPSSATESPQTAYPSWPQTTSTQPAPYRTQKNASPGFGSRRKDEDDDLFEDDDASPVAPSARTREVPSSSSGSSWDRIRQQAKSGSPNWEGGDSSGQEKGWAQLRQDKTRNPRDSNPKTDSYSYSNDDEERERRNYEKEQAQKEFDALLEAERNGDGNSGASRGRRR
ncbi:hypothetical protein F4860DRAFT_288973 [Xylaria cubensis]|nr:hypothetical protein F4860DRAFT_288973 [Xylaria cubensis]